MEINGRRSGGRCPTLREPLGDIVGIGRSGKPTNVSEHAHEFEAETFTAASSDEDGDIVEIYSPSSPSGVEFVPEHLLGKPITENDPIWDIVGIGQSEGPNDVARNKHKYLADAILSRKSAG